MYVINVINVSKYTIYRRNINFFWLQFSSNNKEWIFPFIGFLLTEVTVINEIKYSSEHF